LELRRELYVREERQVQRPALERLPNCSAEGDADLDREIRVRPFNVAQQVRQAGQREYIGYADADQRWRVVRLPAAVPLDLASEGEHLLGMTAQRCPMMRRAHCTPVPLEKR